MKFEERNYQKISKKTEFLLTLSTSSSSSKEKKKIAYKSKRFGYRRAVRRRDVTFGRSFENENIRVM